MNNNQKEIVFTLKMNYLDIENPVLEDGEVYIIVCDSHAIIAAYHRDIKGFISSSSTYINLDIVKYYQAISMIQVEM